MGEARHNKSFPKMHRRWVVKKVMEKKKIDFRKELQVKVLDACSGVCDIPEDMQVTLPSNIASEPAPDKQSLVDHHRSRFGN